MGSVCACEGPYPLLTLLSAYIRLHEGNENDHNEISDFTRCTYMLVVCVRVHVQENKLHFLSYTDISKSYSSPASFLALGRLFFFLLFLM